MTSTLLARSVNISLLGILCAGNVAAQSLCSGNLLTNGDFTSAEGEAITAPGWTPFSTPDVNDAAGPLNCTPGYEWTGIPIASANGGTWQDLFFSETIEQSISVTPGAIYSLCFEYAAQGIGVPGSNTYIDPVGLRVTINSVPVFTTPLDTTQYTWESICFNFTTPLSTALINFTPSDTEYVAIDGACVVLASTEGINELQAALDVMTLHPNPAGDQLFLELTLSQEVTLKVFNSMGAEVNVPRSLRGGSLMVDTSLLPDGAYVLQVVGDHAEATRKFLVDRSGTR